jgi:hypothetical protein
MTSTLSAYLPYTAKKTILATTHDTMLTTRAIVSAPSHPPASVSAPFAALATLPAPTDDDQQVDVDLFVTQQAAADAISIQFFKLATSPPSSDIPLDDRLRNPQELAATNCFIIILDEKLDDKTWNPYQQGFIFRHVIPDLVIQSLTPATRLSLSNTPSSNENKSRVFVSPLDFLPTTIGVLHYSPTCTKVPAYASLYLTTPHT